jgi:hypothetical protein
MAGHFLHFLDDMHIARTGQEGWIGRVEVDGHVPNKSLIWLEKKIKEIEKEMKTLDEQNSFT